MTQRAPPSAIFSASSGDLMTSSNTKSARGAWNRHQQCGSGVLRVLALPADRKQKGRARALPLGATTIMMAWHGAKKSRWTAMTQEARECTSSSLAIANKAIECFQLCKGGQRYSLPFDRAHGGVGTRSGRESNGAIQVQFGKHVYHPCTQPRSPCPCI